MNSNSKPSHTLFQRLALQIPSLRSLVQSNEKLVPELELELERALNRIAQLEHYPAALLKLEQDTATMRLAETQSRLFITICLVFWKRAQWLRLLSNKFKRV